MAIDASLVSELRRTTGCGIMDCKTALQEAEGNIAKAEEILRKKGIAKAAKKASRIASEGIIKILLSESAKEAIMVEVNCETDFVAKDASFLEFVNLIAQSALTRKLDDIQTLHNFIAQGTQTIEELRLALIAKLGENILIRRVYFMKTSHHLGVYLHGSRIGVLVDLEEGSDVLAKDIAMHIAALNPLVISQEQVPESRINQEQEIYLAQAEKTGKPQEIIQKMVAGKIKKYLDDMSLLGQPFVKDPDKTIKQLLTDHSAKVLKFVRFELGEGIEKASTNFAEEVKALSENL